jgi:tetratricopeptide (TPR) repeat protein
MKWLRRLFSQEADREDASRQELATLVSRVGESMGNTTINLLDATEKRLDKPLSADECQKIEQNLDTILSILTKRVMPEHQVKEGLERILRIRQRISTLTITSAENETTESSPRESENMQGSTADDCWERAIAAADAGDDEAAVEAFQRAIECNPDYYVSVIKPASRRAETCWKRAVDAYIKKEDAQIQHGSALENHCVVCNRDLGNHWHYFFESLLLGDTIGTQCTECNRTVCKEHMGPASDGENLRNPCPECGGKVIELQKGPSYLSMVEMAQSERRYRGVIRHPSAFGRIVIRG